MINIGSHIDIATPGLIHGGTGILHSQITGGINIPGALGVSENPRGPVITIPPNLMGKRHCQQVSVTGLKMWTANPSASFSS
jgi:hypothetical protein